MIPLPALNLLLAERGSSRGWPNLCRCDHRGRRTVDARKTQDKRIEQILVRIEAALLLGGVLEIEVPVAGYVKGIGVVAEMECQAGRRRAQCSRRRWPNEQRGSENHSGASSRDNPGTR